jgi:hypothetical protein
MRNLPRQNFISLAVVILLLPALADPVQEGGNMTLSIDLAKCNVDLAHAIGFKMQGFTYQNASTLFSPHILGISAG